jgi:iron complex transport system ATP-binding protein
LYDDKKIKDLRKEELAKKRAVMSQQADLGFPLLVEEVVMMGRYPHFTFNPNKKDITICNEVIERMNLTEFTKKKLPDAEARDCPETNKVSAVS